MRIDAHPLVVAVALGLLAPAALRPDEEGEATASPDDREDEAIAAATAALARVSDGSHVVTLAESEASGVPPVR